MSAKQNTVYIVRPGNTLKALLDSGDEPARELAFMSWWDAEAYIDEMIDRARLDKVYLTEAECESDEQYVIEGVEWGLSHCHLLFRSGARKVLASVDRVPLGA